MVSEINVSIILSVTNDCLGNDGKRTKLYSSIRKISKKSVVFCVIMITEELEAIVTIVKISG